MAEGFLAEGRYVARPEAGELVLNWLFTGEKTCIDCHKGIAHHLPDMRGIPGWQSPADGLH